MKVKNCARNKQTHKLYKLLEIFKIVILRKKLEM